MPESRGGDNQAAPGNGHTQPVITVDGRQRVVVQRVQPDIDCGRFAVKHVLGEQVRVYAEIFSDGHDTLSAALLYRHHDDAAWRRSPLTLDLNDQWYGSFTVDRLGTWLYTVEGWVDHYATWLRDLRKKFDAAQHSAVDFQIGCNLIAEAASRAENSNNTDKAETLRHWARRLGEQTDSAAAIGMAENAELRELISRCNDPAAVSRYSRLLRVTVDRPKALFSAWYELFPRSCGDGLKHGTLRDVERRLPQIAEMGFDVLYLPPIHPIGQTNRKGRNNAPQAEPDDVGSPWAIGNASAGGNADNAVTVTTSTAGGHVSIHPQLGKLDDFQSLRRAAEKLGIELALDIALQCSPDHPYVAEHPDWFKWRPDGTVQYAENPPKKYQDILPLYFESPTWAELWQEMKRVFEFWIDQGVRIFRVDNPHTKPFVFWEWLISEIKRQHNDVLFLSEAFTRPKSMYMLAKAGFTQSYTYFTWRNTHWEIKQYMDELINTEAVEYFRPNFWPNTPDILPQYLQYGNRAAFLTRLILAATLSSNYGIYGPPFELREQAALPGREEYLNSEKFEIRDWDLDRPGNLREAIRWINRLRRENAALQQTRRIKFCETSNELLLAYVKTTPGLENIVLVVVNLDNHHTQSGRLRVPLDYLQMDPQRPFLVYDLLSNDHYIWHGEYNFVQIDPAAMPAHILAVRQPMARETDFDYFPRP